MNRARFHFAYTFRFLRYAIVLALLPFISLLLRWDLAGLRAAFLQDALIILAVGCAAFAMWWVTDCRWTASGVEVRAGFLYRQRKRVSVRQIAVVEIQRPLHCRILGASIVVLYFTSAFPRKKQRVYLSKARARALCDCILPEGDKTDADYRASGVHRLLFILLSANVFSSILIGFFTYRQIADILGERVQLLRDWAISGILTLEQIFEALLPVGAAILAAILTVLVFFTLLRSFFHTFGYRTRRTGNLLLQTSGLLEKTERRIRLDQVGYCDIRHTPFSRLVRLQPVYITAGSYNGSDTPLTLCRGEEDPRLASLLPGYRPPGPAPLSNRGIKSLAVYLWLPLAIFSLFLLLMLTASRVLPGVLPLLAIPLLLALGSMALGVDGYLYEGAAARPGGGIWASYARFFTRHSVTCFTPMLSLRVRENPIGVLQGRVTLRIKTPAGTLLRIRGIGRTTALDMRFTR